jgi:hypothetical protein
MSSIIIRDLSHSKELDRHAMSAVHGGQGPSIGSPTINVGVNVVQNLEQIQVTNVNVLNNSIVGPSFPGLDIDVNPHQTGHLSAKPTVFG